MIKEYNYYITTNRFSQIAEELETTVRSYAESIGKKDENELREKARSLCSSHLVSSGLRSKENSFINIDAEFFDGGELLEANLNRFIKDVLKAHGYQKVLWEYMGTTGMMTEISKSAMKIDGFNYENYLPAGLKEKEAAKGKIKLNRNFNRLQDDSGFDWSRGYDPNDTIEKKGWFSDYDENGVWTRYVTNGENENTEKINSSEKIFKIKLIKTEKGYMLYDPGMILLNPILLWYLTQDDEVYGAEESDTLKIVNEIKTQMKKIGVTKITEIAWGSETSAKTIKSVTSEYKKVLAELADEKLTVIDSVQAEKTAAKNATSEKTAIIQKEAQSLQKKIDAVINTKPDCTAEELARYIQSGKTEMPVDVMEEKDAELAGFNEDEYQTFISFAAELQGKKRVEFAKICAVLSSCWNEYKSCARSKEECMKLLFDYVKAHKENDFNYELTLKQVLETPVQQLLTESETAFDEKVTERIIKENLPQENQEAALEYIASLPEQAAENKNKVFKTLCSAVKNYLTVRMSTGMSIKELFDYAVKTSGGKLPKASFTPPVVGYINPNVQSQTAKDSTGEKRIYFEGKVSGLFDALKVHKLPQKEVPLNILQENYEKALSKKRKPVINIGFTESNYKTESDEKESLWFDIGEYEGINPVILAILKAIDIEDNETKSKILTIAKSVEVPEVFVTKLSKNFTLEYNFENETARETYLLERPNVSKDLLTEYVQDFEEEAEKTVSSKEYESSQNVEIKPVFTQVDFKDLKSAESVESETEESSVPSIKVKNKIALPSGYCLMKQKTSAGGVLEKITCVSARKFETISKSSADIQNEEIEENEITSNFIIEKANSIEETYLNPEEKKIVKLLFNDLSETEKHELIYAVGEDWNNITPLLIKEFIWRKQNKKSTQNILKEITVYERLKEIPHAELEKYITSSTVHGSKEIVHYNRQSQIFYEDNTEKLQAPEIKAADQKSKKKQSAGKQKSDIKSSEEADIVKSDAVLISDTKTAIPVIKLTEEEKEYLQKTYGLQTEELSPVIQEYIKGGEWKNERNILLLKDAIKQTTHDAKPSETVKIFMEKLSSFDKDELLYAADGNVNNITPLFLKEFLWRKTNDKSVKNLLTEVTSFEKLSTIPQNELEKFLTSTAVNGNVKKISFDKNNLSFNYSSMTSASEGVSYKNPQDVKSESISGPINLPVIKLTPEEKYHYSQTYGLPAEGLSPVVQAYIKSGAWKNSSKTGSVRNTESFTTEQFAQSNFAYNDEYISPSIAAATAPSLTNDSLSHTATQNATGSITSHKKLPHSKIQTHAAANIGNTSAFDTAYPDSVVTTSTAAQNEAYSTSHNEPLTEPLKESLSRLASIKSHKSQNPELSKLDRINANYEHDKAVLAKNDPLFAKNQFWDVGHADGTEEMTNSEMQKAAKADTDKTIQEIRSL